MAEEKVEARQGLVNSCNAEVDKIQRAIDKLAARKEQLLIVSGKAFANRESSREFVELAKAGDALIEKVKKEATKKATKKQTD